MNEEARAELDRILAQGPESSTEDEKAFVNARRDYLTEAQRIKFGIDESGVVSSDESEGVEASAKPARKARTPKAE